MSKGVLTQTSGAIVEKRNSVEALSCASRREFLKASLGTLGSLAASESGWAAGQQKPSADIRVDNVILIVSDTMRRDALSLYGDHWIPTPHIDRFAREAVVFDNCFISSFPTVLLRNDLITGRYTFTYKPWSPLDDDAVTLQSTLNHSGILTALIADTPHPPVRNFDILTGPGVNNWDVGMHRDIPIHESMRLQFRAEFFNARNHVQFANPDNNVAAVNFGRVSSTQEPAREIQLALKLLW